LGQVDYTSKELSFSGHGFKSGVQTELGMQKNSNGTYKDDHQNLYIPYFSKNLIIRLKKVLAKDAIYISWGCGSGNDEQRLQTTANLLGIPAKGFTGKVSSGSNPDYQTPTAFEIMYLKYIQGLSIPDYGYNWNIKIPTNQGK